MSFGVSAGDIIAISALAWRCYKCCRDSSDQFQRISGEVSNLKAVLDETKEAVEENQPLSPTREQRLKLAIAECEKALQDLEKLLGSYESMNTQNQRVWDRLNFGLKDLSEVRSRMISHTTTLGALSLGIHHSGMARLQKKLHKYAAEHRAGFRQGSVLSFRTGATVDTLDDWTEVKRELEDVGISSLAIDEHREYIKNWLQEAMEAGAMEEDPNLVHGSPGGSIVSLPPLQSLSLETASAPLPFPLSDSGEGMSRRTTRLSSEPTLVNDGLDARRETLLASQPTLANQIFDDKWLELREETGEEPDVPPSLTPTTKRRKSSQLGSLIHKLLKSDQKIIQAASDGDAAEVERLLSVGVNVNTKDKWGWTAMLMAAYGGHAEVARVLMSRGATLDHEDVDHDTPLSLARNKGHRTLVMMIEQETTRRATEGIE